MAVAAAQQESGRQSVEDSWETWKFDLRVDALLAHVERQAVRQERERMLDMMRVRVQMRDNGPRGAEPPVATVTSHVGPLRGPTFTAERPPMPTGPEENLSQATTAIPGRPGGYRRL